VKQVVAEQRAVVTLDASSAPAEQVEPPERLVGKGIVFPIHEGVEIAASANDGSYKRCDGHPHALHRRLWVSEGGGKGLAVSLARLEQI
jgi:hypothetical protein